MTPHPTLNKEGLLDEPDKLHTTGYRFFDAGADHVQKRFKNAHGCSIINAEVNIDLNLAPVQSSHRTHVARDEIYKRAMWAFYLNPPNAKGIFKWSDYPGCLNHSTPVSLGSRLLYLGTTGAEEAGVVFRLQLHAESSIGGTIMKIKPNKISDPRIKALFDKGDWTINPNPVLMALGASDSHLGKNQIQIILMLIRFTLGMQKWSAPISNAQLRKYTGLDRTTISRNLASLRKRNIVIKYQHHSWKKGLAAVLGLEFDPRKWKSRKAASDESPLRVNRTQEQVANHAHKQLADIPPLIERCLKKKELKRENGAQTSGFLIDIENDRVHYEK